MLEAKFCLLFFAIHGSLAAIGEAPLVNGQWGDWQNGSCSVSCGEGLRPRFRNCDNPAPSGGGAKCVGPALQHDPCHMGPCPIDGGWNDWSEWSACSGSCRLGSRRRTRSCKAPAPQHGGKPCDGPSEETELCTDELAQPCPQNGGWSEWIAFLPCPTDIGEVCRNPTKHQQVRQRFCTNPVPAYGGSDCEGSEFEYTPCASLYACTDGGRWSAWNHGKCSVTCGVGLERLTRSCLDTKLSRNCSGPTELIQECKMPPCRIDGAWSSWHETKSCRVAHVEDPCEGDGPDDDDIRILERMCNDPAPSNGGAFCQGDAVRMEKCREVYGCGPRKNSTNETSWTNWELQGPCGVTCGSGLQRRRRQCLSTSEKCPGPPEDVVTCHMPPCPSTTPGEGGNGLYTISIEESSRSTAVTPLESSSGYSQWTEWTPCDAQSCRQTRWRLCQSKRGGCYGSDVEKRTCADPADFCLAAALRSTAESAGSGATRSHVNICGLVIVAVLSLTITFSRK